MVICLERDADMHTAQLMTLSVASVKSRLVLPLWYRLTRVVQGKGPLNVCLNAYFFWHNKPLDVCINNAVENDFLSHWVAVSFFGFPEIKWPNLTGEVDKCVRISCQILSGFYVPKSLKSVNFDRVIQKIKRWTFLGHGVVYMSRTSFSPTLARSYCTWQHAHRRHPSRRWGTNRLLGPSQARVESSGHMHIAWVARDIVNA